MAVLWPQTIYGKIYYLTRLQAAHINDLWPLICDDENSRLFLQTYNASCADASDLKRTLAVEEGLDDVATFTIMELHSRKAHGWLRMQANADDDVLRCAVFTRAEYRTQLMFDFTYMIGVFTFETARRSRLEARVRSLGCEPLQNYYGFGLMTTIRRQALVKEQSQKSDLLVTDKAVWPAQKKVLDLWVNSLVA